MNTNDVNDLNELFETFDASDTFDGSRNTYCRYELEARYDYLIEMTKSQAWLDEHRQEFNTLQDLLYKVPETNSSTSDIVAEHYVHTYCKNLAKTYICTENTFIADYIDLDAIANAIIKDLPKIDVNGKIFYWFNCSDF